MKYVLTAAAGVSVSVLLSIVLVAFFIFSSLVEEDSNSTESQNITELKHANFSNSINLIKDSYISQISQSKDFCTGQFKGLWVDNSSSVGCFGMSSFSLDYCSTGAVRQMTDLCSSIGGTPICTTSQASCSI